MTCAICGLGDHRYGTTDPEHKYDAMGCVNMLLPKLREANEEIERLKKEQAAAAKCLATVIADWVPENDRMALLGVIAEVALS